MKNYCRQYKLNSIHNKYHLLLKLVEKNNEMKLNLTIIHYKLENKFIYYTEKTLKEIHNENNSLSDFKSLNSLIDYFSYLTKQDAILIEKNNPLLYNLIFIDQKQNEIAKFNLVRELGENLEKEIINLNMEIQKLNNILKEQKLQLEKNKRESDRISNLEQKFEEIQRKQNIIIEEIKKKNDNNINIITNKETDKESTTSNIINHQNIDINSSKYPYNDNKNNILQNSENNIINEEEKGENNKHNILKENNNEIFYSDIPNENNKKLIISRDEVCSIFTAFNIENNQGIIIWITEKRNHEINIENVNNKGKNCISAHNKRINLIKYFHNENISEKNDYIVSYSEDDEETLKVWEIINGNNLSINKVINKSQINNTKIIEFCIFNNKFYSKDNCYFFMFGENLNNKQSYFKDRDIICYKLDNQLKILQWENDNNNNSFKKISNNTSINYLDTYYYDKNKRLYLIICHNGGVILIENALKDYKKLFFSNGNTFYHLSAFMVERKNNLELFDSYSSGIFIWDIKDINNCKININLNGALPYDLCLWNENYLWASTDLGFILIKIIDNKKSKFEKEILLCIEKSQNKSNSKIRKIAHPELGKTIVGLDSNNKLCLWPIIKQKNE